MQLMLNPDIQGNEYQQGTLAGYETREYLLQKWDRTWVYCGAKDIPLQVEHIHPRAKGGSSRLCNLTLSCEKCNLKKGTKDVKEFLKKDPEKLKRILSQTKKPASDAAAVNTTRFALLECLKQFGLPVETASGGLTKFNRSSQLLDKHHWIDAACVGKSTRTLNIKGVKPLLIKAIGHGNRQMCITNKFGFPIKHRSNIKFHFGFRTGDMVRATLPTGKFAGTHVGRVVTRATGVFDMLTVNGNISPVRYKYVHKIQRHDGYSYAT